MNNRANKPDTQADIELRDCLLFTPPRSFIMKAGAGSGKTTSLIKGLTSAMLIHGKKLKKSRQRIACITYTEIAAAEIWKDVGNDPLVHVSTIHSFMWLLAKPFQHDIRIWVKFRLEEKINTLNEKISNYGTRVQKPTKDKDSSDLFSLQNQLLEISKVKSFRYGVGSDYRGGVLGHDDILRLVPYLITERPLFRSLLAHQFPIVFVDESQDTTKEVVDALKLVVREPGVTLCLGFFGDPMQRIYPTGIGSIEAEASWKEISKHENFRCSTKVLNLANAIRRCGDDLVQVTGKRIGPNGIIPPPVGSAKIFILPANDERDTNLGKVRKWMATHTSDKQWCLCLGAQDHVKHLVIVHQMAAKRLGFGELYTALNNRAPTAFKEGFLDGTSWPLSACVKALIPIAISHKEGRKLEVMRLVRLYSPVLEKDNLVGVNIAEKLQEVSELVALIAEGIVGDSNVTIGELLCKVYASGLLILDPRLTSYLTSETCTSERLVVNANERVDDDSEKERVSITAFFSCPAKQLLAYHSYISELSPFSTQQGIKGAEFDRVLVILDDAESSHFQFSYEKYLGLKTPSATDLKHQLDGEDTSIDRTRRLFYVCCTRARKDLAVVLFTDDPDQATQQICKLSLFDNNDILSQADI